MIKCMVKLSYTSLCNSAEHAFINAVLHKRSAPSFEVGSEVERYHQRQPNICTCGEIGSTRYLEVVVLRRGGSNPLRCTILVLMYTNGRV